MAIRHRTTTKDPTNAIRRVGSLSESLFPAFFSVEGDCALQFKVVIAFCFELVVAAVVGVVSSVYVGVSFTIADTVVADAV